MNGHPLPSVRIPDTPAARTQEDRDIPGPPLTGGGPSCAPGSAGRA